MPYKIRKLPRRDLYRVTGAQGQVKSRGTTLQKAKAQVRLLNVINSKKLTK